MDRPNHHHAGLSPDLYPRLDPYGRGHLEVDGGHKIYWEQSGNPKGMPVVFLHGGPGAGANATHRRFFDPDHYRIILFDQRGAGRSEPFGEIRNNTTQDLVRDMECLRGHLGIDRWIVFGGSWGSTLALVYGITHPNRCLGFVLRGIFLGQRAEVDWFLNGMHRIFPEAWGKFSDFIPEPERGNLLQAYRVRLMDPDPAIHMPAAERWSNYESACSTLRHHEHTNSGSSRGALSLARLEVHYFENDIFLPEGYILDNIPALTHLPAVIVQGRYDIICPIGTADALKAAWPKADYEVIPDAGHSAMEPGIRSALVEAMNRYRTQITP